MAFFIVVVSAVGDGFHVLVLVLVAVIDGNGVAVSSSFLSFSDVADIG